MFSTPHYLLQNLFVRKTKGKTCQTREEQLRVRHGHPSGIYSKTIIGKLEFQGVCSLMTDAGTCRSICDGTCRSICDGTCRSICDGTCRSICDGTCRSTSDGTCDGTSEICSKVEKDNSREQRFCIVSTSVRDKKYTFFLINFVKF